MPRKSKSSKTGKQDDIDTFLEKFVTENLAANDSADSPNNENQNAVVSDDLIPTVETPTTSAKPSIDGTGTKNIEDIIAYGHDMYKFLKDYVKKNPDFMKWPDKKRLDYFRETLNHKEFMTEFPIVTRYMICMGQYSNHAFRRLLTKISKVTHPPPHERAKGYMEDQWVRRQADYVRYLWEEYQKKKNAHINAQEASIIWEDAYKTLKGEFDDFRDKYKQIEEKSKEEKKVLAGENAQDLLERLKTGKQKLSEDDEKKLLEDLQPLLWKKRYSVGPIKQLHDYVVHSKVKFIEASCQGYGVAEEVKDKPTITMIEHLANPERIEEVPQHMLLDPETAQKLPGFAPQ